MKITIFGPLPPRKWISAYVYWFVQQLSKSMPVQVIDFQSMYPKRVYPWWDPKQLWVDSPVFDQMEHVPIVVWRNPYTWIRAWMAVTWSILHMQYWIWVLAPIYICMWLIARFIKNIPVIITVHNVQPHEKNKRKLLIDKAVYATAHRYIVHSLDNKNQLLKIVGDNKPIDIFPHWIIVPQVQRIPKVKARDKLSIWWNKKILLFFGIIRPYKWLHTLLEALQILLQYDKEYMLVIAWKCREDRSSYQDVIDAYAMSNSIVRIDKFLDDREVNEVFCASDMLILPYTHFDAQSGVVALGLWYEMPMIVSNLWWLTEVIDDKRYVRQTNNVEDLVSIIRSVDIDASTQYIATKKKEFSWEVIVDRYKIFIQNVWNRVWKKYL